MAIVGITGTYSIVDSSGTSYNTELDTITPLNHGGTILPNNTFAGLGFYGIGIDDVAPLTTISFQICSGDDGISPQCQIANETITTADNCMLSSHAGTTLTTPSWTYTPPTYGCMDDTACNYDSNATANDDSCVYVEEILPCGCFDFQHGDLNFDCQTDIVDVVNIVEMVIHETPFTEQELMICDINSDTTVNVVDLVMIVSFIIGALFK